MKKILSVDWKTIIINLIIFLFLLLILEFVLYLGLTRPKSIPSFLLPSYQHYYQISDRNIVQVSDCGEYDSGLFYMLKPGQCRFKNREFDVALSINAAGLRDDEASLEYPSILVLGDSYAMGWGVEQEESFPQVLEQLTATKVLNAGVSSFGTVREIKIFDRLKTDSVQLIVWQYHANDAEENETFLNNNYHLPIRKRSEYDELSSYINKRQGYYPLKHMYGLSKGYAKQLQPASALVPESKNALSFMQVIARSNIDKDKIKIMLIKVGDGDEQNDAFLSAVDSLNQTPEYKSWNIKTVSLSGSLTPADYFVLDDHINANGHKKIAELLYQQIKSANQLSVNNENQ